MRVIVKSVLRGLFPEAETYYPSAEEDDEPVEKRSRF